MDILSFYSARFNQQLSKAHNLPVSKLNFRICYILIFQANSGNRSNWSHQIKRPGHDGIQVKLWHRAFKCSLLLWKMPWSLRSVHSFQLNFSLECTQASVFHLAERCCACVTPSSDLGSPYYRKLSRFCVSPELLLPSFYPQEDINTTVQTFGNLNL